MDRGLLPLIGRWRCLGSVNGAVFALCLAVVASCGGGSSGNVTAPAASAPELTVLSVILTSDTMPEGQSAAASAVGRDQRGAEIGIGRPIWSTTSPSVATVSASGVVSAVAPGQTMVIASVNGKQGQRSLTVVRVAINRLAISPGTARVARGATIQLTAIALDFSGRALPDRKIDWSTSDAGKAIVTADGLVTGVAPGVASIVATAEGTSASVAVTVPASVDSVATVSVSPSSGSVTVGGSVQLVATLKDANGNTLAGRLVTWSVTGVVGSGVATVSGAGVVTAMSPGAVLVEAFSEGQHGAATITVKDNVDTSIVVTFASPVVNELVGDTLHVAVGVNGLYPVASVVATVGPMGKQLTLKYARVGALGSAYLWVGLLDVTDFPNGPYPVVATVTDARGARGVGSIQFQRDTRTGKGGSPPGPPRMK